MKYHHLAVILIAAILHESIATIEYTMREGTSEEVLGLSSWELYVINDLFFQITVKKCPKIDRPAVSSLKDYITEAVKMAPQNNDQHSDFLEAYTKLVNCYDHIDHASSNPGKKLPSVQFINDENPLKKSNNAETNSKESWILPKDSEEKAKSKDTPLLDGQAQTDLSHWQWMSKVAGLFSDIFRQKRSEPEKDAQEIRKPEIKKHAKNKALHKFTDAKHNFVNMLHEINRVVRVSCPADLMPSGFFSRKALLETVLYAAMDSHSLVRASSKYFDQNSLLEQVHECLQTL